METKSWLVNRFSNFKNDFFNSKKYWISYLVLILLHCLFNEFMKDFNLNHMLCISLLSLGGIFCISYCYRHNCNDNLYKSAFVIIVIFGVLFSFLSPLMFIPDEAEHFVRAEMTSRGIIIPEYLETPYVYGESIQRGYYMTIQSTLDLIDDFKITEPYGYDYFPISNLFLTKVVDKPINTTLVKYHSAFAQNPFYGYIVPGLGMLFAKLLNLNAIWLLWFGRIFNALLYAFLVAFAIKKTPILKLPLLIIACVPLTVMQASSLSIDSLINGLGIFSIAYFFKMYSSKDLTPENILKFSFIVLLLGLCKITYFSFIFLLIFVPKNNFKEKNQYFLGFLSIFILALIAVLWSKYYANPNYLKSYRFAYYIVNNINPSEKLTYLLSHKVDAFLIFLGQFFFSLFELNVSIEFNTMFLLFLLGVVLFYPKPQFTLKSRCGVLLVFLILYCGTLFIILLTWTSFNNLFLFGFHSRYIFPALALLPFTFGFNYFKFNNLNLDSYLLVITITFISFNLIQLIEIY